MWSLGCILGEILIEKPLFPGKSTLDQIEKISHVMGFSKDYFKTAGPRSKSSTTPAPPSSSSSSSPVKDKKVLLDDLVKQSMSTNNKSSSGKCDPTALQLLKSLLAFEPENRITAEEALTHKYVSRFHNPKDFVIKECVIPTLSDDVQLSVEQYREKLYEMIQIQKSRAAAAAAAAAAEKK